MSFDSALEFTLRLAPRWLGRSFYARPTAPHPRLVGSAGNSVLLAELTGQNGVPVHVDPLGLRRVSGLIFSGGPSAIAFGVALVVIDTIKGHAIRLSHVFKERREAVSPPLANSNSPSTVVPVVRNVAVGAPAQHSPPDSMLPCPGFPVCRELRAPHVGVPAAATLGVSGYKVPAIHINAVPAATLALIPPAAPADPLDYEQAAERLPGVVSVCTHAESIA